MTFFRKTLFLSVSLFLLLGISSCGKKDYLLIPHSVSEIHPVLVKDLDLKRTDYVILKNITESSSVVCKYEGNRLTISDRDGIFKYKFKFDANNGWNLDSFSGIASFGYFTDNFEPKEIKSLTGEEFARHQAMAKVIAAARDYDADGVIEPIITTTAVNLGHNEVEYTSTVSAKLIVINAN